MLKRKMSSKTLDALPDRQALVWPFIEDLSIFESEPKVATGSDGNDLSILFVLPRELRDLIYSYLLDAHRRSPPSPPFSGIRILRKSGDGTNLKDVSYSVRLPHSKLDGIISSCHAIRHELFDLAAKRNASGRPLSAELDVMAKGYVFYPTWTRLPLLLSRDTPIGLDVRLRIFSPEAFRENDGWPRQPGVGFRSLLTLLNQFLFCGPAFTTLAANAESETRHMRISQLTLRISNRDIYTGRVFPPAVYQIVRMCKAFALRGDAKKYIKSINIIIEDQDVAIPGAKKWHIEVSDVPNEKQIEAWEDGGFYLGPELATFNRAATEPDPATEFRRNLASTHSNSQD